MNLYLTPAQYLAARDQRIALSCSKGDGECGQGWYQRDLADRGRATLAPLLHWRVCHVWEWLKHWAPQAQFGDWTTELLAEAYGGDEAEELQARTGCVGCPLAEKDTAIDSLIARESWSYLAPLKKIRPIWRELGKRFGITSTQSVSDHLKALEAKGYIKRTPGVHRSICVLRTPEGVAA